MWGQTLLLLLSLEAAAGPPPSPSPPSPPVCPSPPQRPPQRPPQAQPDPGLLDVEGWTGLGQSEEGRTGLGQSEEGWTGLGQSEEGWTGLGQSEEGWTGPGQSEEGWTGLGQSEEGWTGPGQSEEGRTGPGQSEEGRTGLGQSEEGRTGLGQSEEGRTGLGQSEEGRTGLGQSEEGRTGLGQSEEPQSRGAPNRTGPADPAAVETQSDPPPPTPGNPPPPSSAGTPQSKRHHAAGPPPVAHAGGSHSLTLPNSSLVLRGSVSGGDQSRVRFHWTRDGQSPAAGAVLFGSDRACLVLVGLVEGSYLFRLTVTDGRGRSSTATATVEVRPEPGGAQQVDLELQVPLNRISAAQRDTVLRQLTALLPRQQVQVRGLQARSPGSTVMRLSIRGPPETRGPPESGGPPESREGGSLSGSRLAALLRNQLLKGGSDYLLFRVLRVDTVACLLGCSGRGQCHPITKQCSCDPFWTENPIRRYLGDGESNCDWSLLYVVLSSFGLMVLILWLSWTFICCCRRARTRTRTRTRYTVLDSRDETERLELRPRFSIRHRSTEQNCSLMMSESDSDESRTRQGGG